MGCMVPASRAVSVCVPNAQQRMVKECLQFATNHVGDTANIWKEGVCLEETIIQLFGLDTKYV